MKTVAELQTELDRELNVLLSQHRGRVEVKSRDNDIVYVTMSGGCHGCPGAKSTLARLVTQAVQTFDPTVVNIIDVTDHSTGQNPFYSAQ